MTKAPSGAPARSPSDPSTAPSSSASVTDQRPGHARIIAIANQKGGVGKSTTAVSLGAALADLGYMVLVVDLDPQGNASTGLGIRHDARATTVYDVVVAEAPVERAVVRTAVTNLHAIPSTIDLAGAEIELVSQFSRESRLKRALEPLAEGSYDFVLLDCPPSLGLLTVNALTAAEELIVPIQCEYYALEGLGQLLRNVSLVQQNINPGLRLTGIVMTMFDPRTKLSEQVVDEVRRFFGDLVYDVIIPRTVRLSEAPGYGQPITVYDPRSKGAETYRDLAREVAERPPPETPMPSFEELSTMVVSPLGDTEGGGASTGTDPEPRSERSEPDLHADPEPDAGVTPPPSDDPDAATSAAAPVDRSTAVEPDPAPPEAEPADDRSIEPPPRAASAPSAAKRQATPPRPAPDDVWEREPGEQSTSAAPRASAPQTPTSERRVVRIRDDRDIDIRAGQERPPDAASAPSEDHEAVTPIGATLKDEGGRRRRWRLFRKGGEG